MLKIKNLSMGTILRNISLEIPENKITLLLGKSGSGKTTLLRCIAHLEKNYIGEILYQDQPLSTLPAKDRCRVLGFVPQSYALFPHMTLLDNCVQPLRLHGEPSAQAKALKMLESLDMGLLARRKPHELSGGEQQRGAIARALALDPTYLLFDEPTSALDPENTTLFITLLRQLKKGMLIATQDMAFAAKLLDRAFFMENGAVIEHHESTEFLSFESRLGKFLDKELVKK